MPDSQPQLAERTPEPRGQIEETLLRATPAPATVKDAVGVERIVEPTVPDWEPAPVQPNPEDVERSRALEERFAEQKEARLTRYSAGDVGESAKVAKKAIEAETGGQVKAGPEDKAGSEDKPKADEKKTGGRGPEGRTTVSKAE